MWSIQWNVKYWWNLMRSALKWEWDEQGRCATRWRHSQWQHVASLSTHRSTTAPPAPRHYCCSFTKLCLILCGPMDYSMPGSSVFHYLPVCSNSHALTQWCLTISSSAAPFSFWLQSFTTLRTFPMSWFFTSGDQIIGASASASLLPMNI